MFYLILVLIFVLYMFSVILWDFYGIFNTPKHRRELVWRKIMMEGRTLTHSTLLEIVWTLTPSFILMLIAIPSFSLLYSMDEVLDPALTIKAIGHQWYWSYEYSDYVSTKGDTISFDSYMIPTEELSLGQFRLLEVDNSTVLPINTHIRVLVTAVDVLHSWAVPSLGVKVDAVPGRT